MKKYLVAILLCVLCASAVNLSYGDKVAFVQEERVVEQQPTLRVSGDQLELRNPETEPVRFTVYSITGQVIKTVTLQPAASTRFRLPKGFYIVKCEYWTKRIMLK